jgi:Ca2+-binding EF-hand superfamily protein
MAVDHSDTLLSKFRSQLKKMKISVEKAYKTFDPNNLGSVQKKDFIEHCFGMGFNFSEDELIKLFENIC